MTLQDIAKLPKMNLTAADVAPILGSDPNTIRWQAREYPQMLGFPVVVAKSRVKIPKAPFLRFYGWEGEIT